MMAGWRTPTLILTVLLSWFLPHGSYGVPISCWWRRVPSLTSNVSIECQADPQGPTLKCDLCHLRVPFLDLAAYVSQAGCSRTSVSFSALTDVHEMQNADCALLCPGHTSGHTPLTCILQEGYPPPTCFIPFDDQERNIHCHWTASLNPLIPTKFTLHWTVVDEHGYNGSIDVGQSGGGIIPRAEYSAHEYIKVWVSTANTLGTIDSEVLMIDTQSILQPATPLISSHASEALEISWTVPDEAQLSRQWQCKVQYKKQCDQEWTEVEDTYEVSFTLEEAEPFTTYKFRVRCRHASDESAVMSEWSSEYTAETPAAAPVGTLDVWCNCDSTSDESSCTILWKEMPKQQARGNINSYEVSMKLSNGSVLNIPESAHTSAETCAQCRMGTMKQEPLNLVSLPQQSYLRCPQEKDQSCFHYCHLSVSVKEVTGIGVTADTSGGKSIPAHVALPRTDLQQPAVVLEVRGKTQELNVSWSVQPPFSDSLQEYVVQHKPVGLPHSPCLNWVKVHKSQTSVMLTGQLSNYTAYNMSLFAIINNSSTLLKSVIAYTVEGVPPEVTGLQAVPVSPTTVNLTWTPIPVNESQGHILLYQVSLSHDGVVYNVSSNQSSLQLDNLNPGQQYVVWITAVTSAGGGKNATACFTTASSGNIATAVAVIVILLFIVPLALIIFGLWWCSKNKGTRWFYQIPDPINSSSFKQMSNQFWHSWPVPSSSMEYGLTISQVEVVPKPVVDHEPEVEQPEENREHEQSREKDLKRHGGLEQNNSMLRHQKEYSQMIDTSDEEGREDEDSEWDEQPFPSDYEKHFLPITVDA